MTKSRGKPRNDDPKDEWKSYQPRKRTPRDYETNAAILDVNPPDQLQRERARYTVACHSKDADELKEFMLMLGIYPEPSEVKPKPKRKRKVSQK
jgi:hypothetical protein